MNRLTKTLKFHLGLGQTPSMTTPETPMELYVPREGMLDAVQHALTALRDQKPEDEDERQAIEAAIVQREESKAWLKAQPGEYVYIVFYFSKALGANDDHAGN